MKNIKMAETAARYGMTPVAFERLLVELGWMENGELLGGAAEYVTKDRELTPMGRGYLDVWLRR